MEEHCHIICFDLCQPDKDYYNFYKALKSFGVCQQLTDSTWAVVCKYNCIEIRDYLMSFIGNEDRLIVILCGRSAAWVDVITDSNWVKDNLSK